MVDAIQNRRPSSVRLVVYEVIQFCWLRKSAAKHDRWPIYRVTNVQVFTAYKLGPEQGDCSGTLLTPVRVSAMLRSILFEALGGFSYCLQVNTEHYLKTGYSFHILTSFLNSHASDRCCSYRQYR